MFCPNTLKAVNYAFNFLLHFFLTYKKISRRENFQLSTHLLYLEVLCPSYWIFIRLFSNLNLWKILIYIRKAKFTFLNFIPQTLPLGQQFSFEGIVTNHGKLLPWDKTAKHWLLYFTFLCSLSPEFGDISENKLHIYLNEVFFRPLLITLPVFVKWL